MTFTVDSFGSMFLRDNGSLSISETVTFVSLGFDPPVFDMYIISVLEFPLFLSSG